MLVATKVTQNSGDLSRLSYIILVAFVYEL